MASFQKVVRVKAKLRMALTGVSGAGKTLGSLLIAYGITKDWDKIALIDTEHERARMYANRSDLGIGAFMYAPLYPPYTAERYMELVKEAEGLVGEDGAIIIDSFSHAWNGEGGVLEAKDKIAAQRNMNSYTAWNQAGKIQNSLMGTIMNAGCHVIVTMRSKMEYASQADENGKLKLSKIGLAPIQRDDVEYEFDVVLDIARNHVATASKDVTFLDSFGEVITSELGVELKKWLDEGEEPGKIRSQLPITKFQWKEFGEVINNDLRIQQEIFGRFNIRRASDIKQGQLPELIKAAQEYMKPSNTP